MRRSITSLLTLAAAALTLVGCAGPAKLVPADIDQLAGERWKGTLTYLDYTSNKPTTIPSSLAVTRVPSQPSAWEFAFGYSDEPQADNRNTVVLSPDGRTFAGETVLERSTLPPGGGGGMRIVTTEEGKDDNKPATMRYVYLITPSEFSITKFVKFAGSSNEIERHTYRWKR